MSEPSIKKRKRIPMRALDPVLAGRIKELRSSLGLLQTQFAQKLNVSATQISEWEKGAKERPSVEKLLEMASIAPSEEYREWFWRKGGVDLESIKSHFREKVQRRSSLWESSQYLRVPIVRELSVGTNGELLGAEEGILELPAKELSNPASIICLMGANRPPWILRDGSRVIVDRSVTEPQKLLGSMAAVYFEKFPLLDDSLHGTCPPPPTRLPNMFLEEFLEKIDPGGYFSDEPERRQRRELMMEQAKRPGFLVGRLDVEGVDRPSLHWSEPKAGPWRLVLVLQAPLSQIDEIIPLSKWETAGAPGVNPSAPLPPLFPESVRIIGRVLMEWFSVGDDSPSD
jgi:transcriptional regulator with XRE-family HTH domain